MLSLIVFYIFKGFKGCANIITWNMYVKLSAKFIKTFVTFSKIEDITIRNARIQHTNLTKKIITIFTKITTLAGLHSNWIKIRKFTKNIKVEISKILKIWMFKKSAFLYFSYEPLQYILFTTTKYNYYTWLKIQKLGRVWQNCHIRVYFKQDIKNCKT